jgi:hypothetical protein
MGMNWIPFICKSKSSGASTSNLEHLLAELKRINLKLRLRAMQASSAQSLFMLIGVAVADGVDAYNKRMEAGK